MKQEQAPVSSIKPLRITIDYGMDVTTVTFTEDRIVDEEQVRELQEVLRPVIEKNQDKQMIFNFANVKLMNSVLLNMLLRVHKQVHKMGGQLQLSNLAPNLRRVLELMQLTDVFNIS